jgi:capsule polysaccharide export protein KpsE/RkpR
MATRQFSKSQPQYPPPAIEPDFISISGKSPEENRTPIERLRILWDRRSLLYRWIAIGLFASTITAFVIPVRYTSTTRLMPPDQAGQGLASMFAVLGKSSELGNLGSELFGIKTSGDLFLGVLKSETVQNAIINKFDLRKVYGDHRYSDARKQLDNRTDLTSDRKSGIITIKVSDRSPQRAAAIGQEYVKQLDRVVITLDTSAAHRERVFLENRLKQVQIDLESAEKDFSVFASKNTALDVKEQGQAMIGAAGQLEGELIAAQTELEGLLQIYTTNNVRVRSVQARIDEYKRQLQKLEGQAPGSTGNVDNAPGAGQPSSTQNGDLYPSIRQLPILGVTWADLYRRTKVQEAVFETLTKQYEIARVDEAREVPSVKVLDVAAVPEKKSFPPRLIIMLFGTCFVAAICSVYILGEARWRELDPEDPAKKLGEEVFQTFRTNTRRVMNKVKRSRTK